MRKPQVKKLSTRASYEKKSLSAEPVTPRRKGRYEKELKILGADKKASVANAKLNVFEEAILIQELGRESELPSPEVPGIKNEERTSQCVHSSPSLNPPPTDYRSRPGHTQELLNTLEQSKPLSPSAVRNVNLSAKIYQIRERKNILSLIESQLSHQPL